MKIYSLVAQPQLDAADYQVIVNESEIGPSDGPILFLKDIANFLIQNLINLNLKDNFEIASYSKTSGFSIDQQFKKQSTDLIDGLKSSNAYFYVDKKSELKILPMPLLTSEVRCPIGVLFLDRDGIINEDTGYPSSIEEIVFKDGIFDFVKQFSLRGFEIHIITNQSGLAKGLFSKDKLDEISLYISNQFESFGINIQSTQYCPFHKNAKIKTYKGNSLLRKPLPGMILKALENVLIPWDQLYMIGDKVSDKIYFPKLKVSLLKTNYDLGSEVYFESFDEILENTKIVREFPLSL